MLAVSWNAKEFSIGLKDGAIKHGEAFVELVSDPKAVLDVVGTFASEVISDPKAAGKKYGAAIVSDLQEQSGKYIAALAAGNHKEAGELAAGLAIDLTLKVMAPAAGASLAVMKSSSAIEKLAAKVGRRERSGGVVDRNVGKDSPKNRAAHEVYKDELRATMEKPIVSDKRLEELISDIYRENAQIGSGSTAAAVRHELKTGQKVGGVSHSQKSVNSIQALQKWLRNNPAALPGDRAAAENIIHDMINALKGK